MGEAKQKGFRREPLRCSGVLLHIASLPSRFGIGDLGPEAFRFVDFLDRAGQRCWQVLPMGPIDPIFGNSPYNSSSAFAGNVLFISPEKMLEDGFLAAVDLKRTPTFREGEIDYPAVRAFKQKLFHRAFERFRARRESYDGDFGRFRSENRTWLRDYALFAALKSRYRGSSWTEWPRDIRDRSPEALQSAEEDLRDAVEWEEFLQFVFSRQWDALRKDAASRGVELIGDIPCYVHSDSADVWRYPGLFHLDKQGRPLYLAGVPPDYFSRTGQLWGNPVYRWKVHREERYRWWVDRIEHNLRRFDLARIDHFRGLVAYWRISSKAKTAEKGRWVRAPAADLFRTLLRSVPPSALIAEDLGYITPDVTRVLEATGLPGMRVLLFAFGEDMPLSIHAPHRHERHCVVYTGTHDNNTVRGWFENEAGRSDKKRLFQYLGRTVPARDVHREFLRLALGSVAHRVIIPMQDILGLGEDARMNRPSLTQGNWCWRLKGRQVNRAAAEMVFRMCLVYGRAQRRYG